MMQGARCELQVPTVIWPLEVAVTTLRCHYASGVIYGY
jgi:hypothetical protein